MLSLSKHGFVVSKVRSSFAEMFYEQSVLQESVKFGVSS